MEEVLRFPEKGSPEAEVDVVVAGAGPVGLLLGCVLQRAGVNVVLVDPHIAPGEQSKAAVTMPRSFEVMDLVGAGAEAAASGRRVTGLRLAMEREWVGALTGYVVKATPTRYSAVATGQLNIERVLLKRFKELGGRLIRAARFAGYVEVAGGVEVHVERSVYVRPPAVAPELPAHVAEPAQTTFTAKYLVGCDGKQSAVRAAMGAVFSGKEYPQSFFIADAVIEKAEAERCGMLSHELFIIQDFASASFLLIVHMHGSQWRTYYCAKGLDRSIMSEEFIKEKCRRMFPAPGPPEMALHDLSFYRVDCRLVDAYRKGPCLLAGDAAHCHSPAGGQGMNTGLQDAANLGWKLAAVLRQAAPDSLLQSYDLERRPCAEWVLRTSDGIFTAITDQSSATRSALRKILLSLLTSLVPASFLPPRAYRERLFGLTISYADCSTCCNLGDSPPAGALVAGQRLPDLPCAVAGGGERFTLQLLEDPPCYPFLLLYVARSPPLPDEVRRSLEAFRGHSEAGVLLRPCVYVAPAPCCFGGRCPWPAPPAPEAADGCAGRGAAAAEASATGLWPPLRLTPAPGQPDATLAAALRLPARGRALLVVRPDGHVAVAQRGGWSGRAVAEAMEGLSLWPKA